MSDKSIYDQKLNQARSLIENHNKMSTNKVDIEKFIECLKNAGATTDEALQVVSFEDLEECCVPKILAKLIAKVFRKESLLLTEEVKVKPISEKKALSMTIADLLKAYDPKESDNPVGQRLHNITGGEPCIAFDNSGQVMQDVSLKEVNSLRNGFAAREYTRVNGVPVKLYAIGEKFEFLMDENPLYAGSPLRDNECEQTGISWESIPHLIRVLLALAVNHTSELKIDQISDAHNIFDLIINSKNAEKLLRQRFPKTSLLYDEMDKLGTLPKLKLTHIIVDSQLPSYNKKQNPFSHKSY